jgi:murein DD-endopeptidase MepM/ murein hydrolase activator NlpD
MRLFLLLLAFFLSLPFAFSQTTLEPGGGGNYDAYLKFRDDVSPEHRAAIIQQLQANERGLRSTGVLQQHFQPLATSFQWPVKQAPNFYQNGFYGISNYIDNNLSYPGLVIDYNCGTRTYDQASGYNHKGTDIFNWPFPWQKMAQGAVQVVAAAAGTIIGKDDGFSDQSCALCSGCQWNAVYIMHADGSVAWYGHLKLASLTSKLVGQTVAAGEYLGVVGSSGNSTGPHLHFEVYTNGSYTSLVDPWAGPCNAFNGLTSWWATQEPYYVPTLNAIMTHGAPPSMTGCPAGEIVNEKVNFVSGETVYFGGYYRDQLVGQQAFHTIYRPDNSVYASWIQNFNVNYDASWWWYSRILPNPAPAGMWRYQVNYNGQPGLSIYFGVNVSGYTFIGSGNWSVPPNWSNNNRPPAILPAGSEIMIAPVAGGECVVNEVQTINTGAKITVAPGKQLRLTNNLVIQ